MERNKKIYFCVDWISYSRFLGKAKSKYEPVGNAVCCPYYTNTEKALIKEGKDCIVTTSMAHFSAPSIWKIVWGTSSVINAS